MRKRSRSTTHQFGDGTGDGYYYPERTKAYDWPYTNQSIIRTEESMTDTVGFKQNSNYVYHSKMSSTGGSFSGVTGKKSNDDYCIYVNKVSNHRLLSMPELSATQLRAYNSEAFQSMTPSLESDLQGLNFLIELVELKPLFNILNIKKWSPIIKEWSRQKWYKKGASAHLAYSFGAAPFISDVQQIIATVKNYQTIIDNFLAGRGSVQVRHWTKTLDPISSSEDLVWSLGNFTTAQNTVDRKITFTMKYKYDCDDIVSTYDKLRVFSDMFGLNFGLDVLWEAVPFSFVVDWFFNVGDFLSQTRKTSYPVRLDVISYGYSIKSVLKGQTKMTFYPHPLASSPVTFSWYERKVYKRCPCAPESGSFFINYNNRYDYKKLALTCSLFLANS